MKKLFFTLFGLCMLCLVSVAQQNDIAPAKPGVQYGKKIDKSGAISVKQLEASLASTPSFKGKVQGEVVQVCKKKGCFITLKREGDNKPVMVRFTDYGYFLPADVVGKTVVVEGTAKIKEVPVEKLRHAAEDLGKSKEEIAQITAPSKEITFVADGVVVVK